MKTLALLLMALCLPACRNPTGYTLKLTLSYKDIAGGVEYESRGKSPVEVQK